MGAANFVDTFAEAPTMGFHDGLLLLLVAAIVFLGWSQLCIARSNSEQPIKATLTPVVDSLRRIENRMGYLTRRVINLEEDLQDTEGRNRDLEENVERLKGERDVQRHVIGNLKYERRSAFEERNNQRQIADRLQKDVVVLTKERNYLKLENKDLKEENEKLNTQEKNAKLNTHDEVKAACEALAEKEAKVSDQARQLEEMREEKVNFEKDLAARVSELQHTKATILKTEAQLATAETTLEQERKEKADLKKDLTTTTSQLKAAFANVITTKEKLAKAQASLKEEREAKTKDLATRGTELEDAKATAATTKADLEKAQADLKNECEAKESLKNDLSTTRTKLEDALAAVTTTKAEFAKAQAALKEVREAKTNLANDLATKSSELQAANVTLTTQLAAAQNDLQKEREGKGSLENALNSQGKELQAANVTIAETKAQLTAAQTELEKANANLDEAANATLAMTQAELAAVQDDLNQEREGSRKATDALEVANAKVAALATDLEAVKSEARSVITAKDEHLQKAALNHQQELATTVSTAQGALNAKDEESARLKQELAHYKTQQQGHEAQSTAAKRQIETLQAEVAQLKAQQQQSSTTPQAQSAATESEVASLKNEVAQLTAQLNRQQGQSATQVAILQKQLSVQAQKEAEQVKKIQEQKESSTQMARTLKDAEREKQTAVDQASKLEKQLKYKASKLEEELKKQKLQYDSLERAYQTVEDLHRQGQEDLQAAQEDIRSLRKNATLTRNAELEDEIESLEGRIDALERDLKQAENDYYDENEENEKLKARLAKYEPIEKKPSANESAVEESSPDEGSEADAEGEIDDEFMREMVEGFELADAEPEAASLPPMSEKAAGKQPVREPPTPSAVQQQKPQGSGQQKVQGNGQKKSQGSGKQKPQGGDKQKSKIPPPGERKIAPLSSRRLANRAKASGVKAEVTATTEAGPSSAPDHGKVEAEESSDEDDLYRPPTPRIVQRPPPTFAAPLPAPAPVQLPPLTAAAPAPAPGGFTMVNFANTALPFGTIPSFGVGSSTTTQPFQFASTALPPAPVAPAPVAPAPIAPAPVAPTASQRMSIPGLLNWNSAAQQATPAVPEVAPLAKQPGGDEEMGDAGTQYDGEGDADSIFGDTADPGQMDMDGDRNLESAGLSNEAPAAAFSPTIPSLDDPDIGEDNSAIRYHPNTSIPVFNEEDLEPRFRNSQASASASNAPAALHSDKVEDEIDYEDWAFGEEEL